MKYHNVKNFDGKSYAIYWVCQVSGKNLCSFLPAHDMHILAIYFLRQAIYILPPDPLAFDALEAGIAWLSIARYSYTVYS